VYFYFGKNTGFTFHTLQVKYCVATIKAMYFSCVASATHFLFYAKNICFLKKSTKFENFKIFSDFIKSKAVLNCLYYERK